MSDFTHQFYNLIEAVINYSDQHTNRQNKHTFTDIDRNYSRKSQNLVPDYVKAKDNIKYALDLVQKYGTPKVFFPNQIHTLLGRYKIDINELKRGIPKQLGNMNLQISYDVNTGNFIVKRI